MSNEAAIRIWTDGSSRGNPGPSGWAWWAAPGCWGAGGWPKATNNLAELTAVLEALRATSHLANRQVVVVTDSQFVINALTRWVHGWRRNGWKTSAGQPVRNAETIAEIYEQMRGRKVEFVWVRGHNGDAGNSSADALCTAAADAFRDRREVRSGPGWTLS
jgi:ribonuclease HI